MSKIIKVIFPLVLLTSLLWPLGVFAADEDDKFTTCDLDGTTTNTVFSKVTITVPTDEAGNYGYMGVDVGTFKKPADYNESVDEWEKVLVERIQTNSTEIILDDLGALSLYDYAGVYTVAYRILYRPAGDPSNPIVETEWKKVRVEDEDKVLYFKPITPIQTDKFRSCNLLGQGNGIAFSKVTITVPEDDQTGNYSYMGVDVGIFKKPQDYDESIDEWEKVLIERIETDSRDIVLDDMGKTTLYEDNKIYTVAYRILYRPAGDPSNPVVETGWKKVRLETPDQVLYFKKSSTLNVSQFTDRVTGANNWMSKEIAEGRLTEEHAKELNKYFPNSEVVSKFVLDPGGVNVLKYKITFDANSDSSIEKIENLSIDYIKIVRIDYGEVKGQVISNPGPPGGADSPYCGNDNEKSISFEIDNPGTSVLSIYVKSRFRNKEINGDITGNMPSEFENKVSVEVVTSGGTTQLEPMENTIRLRKAIPKYM